MPLNDPVGYAWLKQRYTLPDVPLPHVSYVASAPGWREQDEMRIRGWPQAAWPGDEMGDHLEFALKHEGLNLPLLWHLFRQIDREALARFIAARPSGKYTRKMGFLFEFLTGDLLDAGVRLSGTYEPVLDEERYLCGVSKPNTRWRVHDNLLGTAAFCPIIRRDPRLAEQLGWNPAQSLRNLREHYDSSLFSRATAWLYLMETRSTNEIESETPSPKRMERFVQVLREAGRRPLAETLSYDALVELQTSIVDPRGRIMPGLRGIQNFVGSDRPGYGDPIVAYPCPPPSLAAELLEALPAVALRCEGLHAVVRASVLSFGFVYIHPFEDGNGRISRYLIHDSYVRDGFTPAGFIFPVSAVILKRLREYGEALERHSRPVLKLADYSFDPMTHLLNVHNAGELEPLYRYPDLTGETVYLMQVTRECAEVALVQEIDHLDRMERAKKQLRETLDLPDRRLNLLLAIIHQNDGKLSTNKRASEFPDLDAAEIAEAERCYRVAFARG
jgi:Fic family protein